MSYREILPIVFALMTSLSVHCAVQPEENLSLKNKLQEVSGKSYRPCKKICNRYALDNPRFQRVVVLSQDTTYIDPLIDPNHELALTMKYKNGEYFYTQADIDALETKAYDDLYAKYGIDARSITPNSLGIRVVPGVGEGLPILIGRQKQFYLVLDTKHPNRDQNVSDRWVDVEVDVIFQFTNTYIVPAGFEMTGATAQPGYLFSVGDLNLVKNGSEEITDLTFCAREKLSFTTTWLNTTSVDQWGNIAYNISTDVTDEKGNVGTYLSNTAMLRDPKGASAAPVVSLQERPVIVWDCPASN